MWWLALQLVPRRSVGEHQLGTPRVMWHCSPWVPKTLRQALDIFFGPILHQGSNHNREIGAGVGHWTALFGSSTLRFQTWVILFRARSCAWERLKRKNTDETSRRKVKNTRVALQLGLDKQVMGTSETLHHYIDELHWCPLYFKP